MATQTVRLTMYLKNGVAKTVFVGARSKADAAIDTLQLMLPAMGMKLIVKDEVGFGSFSTGSGTEVLVAMDEA